MFSSYPDGILDSAPKTFSDPPLVLFEAASSVAASLLSSSTFDPALHESLQARQVYPHAPAYSRRPKFASVHVAPQRRMAEPGVPLGLRVGDPLLLYRFFQQLFSLRCLVFLSVAEMIQ